MSIIKSVIFMLVAIYPELALSDSIWNHTIIDPILTEAIVKQESAGNPSAVSSAGAKGLMQIMPVAVADLRQRGYMLDLRCWFIDKDPDLFDPATNVLIGSCYFSLMLIEFGGNVELAIRAYNCGPGCVRSWLKGKRRLPKETIDYHIKVMRNFHEI